MLDLIANLFLLGSFLYFFKKQYIFIGKFKKKKDK
jgi:hypothetical protein